MNRLFINGNFLSSSSRTRRFQAMAVEGERIVATGSGSELLPFADRGYHVVDMAGQFILPGFIDCHSHMIMSGVMGMSRDLSTAGRLSDIFDALSDEAAQRPASVLGFYLDEQRTREKRMPTRLELDRISEDVPVVVMHATCHRCSLNTRAIEAFGLPADLQGLDTDADGPTGVVRDPGILTHVFPAIFGALDRVRASEALHHAASVALSRGITTLHALEGGEFTPGGTAHLLRCAPTLPVRTVAWNQSMNVGEAEGFGLTRAGGCICADGELDARTAALFEPYSDDPGNRGDLLYAHDVMDKFIWAAHEKGMQTAVHCESERSIEQVLRAIEAAQEKLPREDCRHRIEHFELPAPGQIERLAEAGIIASMQPAFLPAFIGGDNMERMDRLFGQERAGRLHPYRTILDAGVRVCGGSDSPVTPYAPLSGMAALIDHPFPEQSLTHEEALSMFTTEAAFAGFEEADKGELVKGRLADFVVMERDPYELGAKELSELSVLQTWVGGEHKY